MKYTGSRRKKKTNRATLIFGLIFSVCAFFLLTLIAAFILSSLKNPLKISGIASFAVLLLCGAISGFCTAKYKGERAILPSGLCAVIFALILFGAGLISSGGRIATITVLNLLSYVALAFISAALASREKKRRSRR